MSSLAAITLVDLALRLIVVAFNADLKGVQHCLRATGHLSRGTELYRRKVIAIAMLGKHVVIQARCGLVHVPAKTSGCRWQKMRCLH